MKLSQLDFDPFWNFTKVVVTNNSDIESEILRK